VKKLLLLIGLMFSFVIAEPGSNWNGYGDTAAIKNFKADTTIYSKIFNLSGFENIRVSCYANDTSSAGFASDSLRFYWGVQTGHMSWITTKVSSPVYEWGPLLVVDTFDILTTANRNFTKLSLLEDGSFVNTMKKIDSSSISGWAYQTRSVATEWDVVYRYFAIGYAGNKTVANKIRLVFQSTRREGVITK
jgi:hypothetical protein